MKSFSWSGWIKPVNQAKNNGFHVVGFNFGNKFDGFHVFDYNKKGKKVKCKHKYEN